MLMNNRNNNIMKRRNKTNQRNIAYHRKKLDISSKKSDIKIYNNIAHYILSSNEKKHNDTKRKLDLSTRKTIKVYIIINNSSPLRGVEVPVDMNEISFKEFLRDSGYIPDYMRTYSTTKVYLCLNEKTPTQEICTAECREIESFGITEKSAIFIDCG